MKVTKANAQAVITNQKNLDDASKSFRTAKQKWENEGKQGDQPDYVKPVEIMLIDPDPAVYTRAIDAATTCLQAFGRSKPLDTSGAQHKSFKTYAEAMEAKASIARDQFDGAWERQEWTAAV